MTRGHLDKGGNGNQQVKQLHLAPAKIITASKITSFFTGPMPFLPSNQQHHSIEGKINFILHLKKIRNNAFILNATYSKFHATTATVKAGKYNAKEKLNLTHKPIN